MNDKLERRIRQALDAEVQAILDGPSLGPMDRARLAQIKQSAKSSELPKLTVPQLADADADYLGMAAHDAREERLSPELEQRIQEIEQQDDDA